MVGTIFLGEMAKPLGRKRQGEKTRKGSEERTKNREQALGTEDTGENHRSRTGAFRAKKMAVLQEGEHKCVAGL